MRADAGYFAGDLARTARELDVRFAIGAKRITTVWRALDGIGECDWTDARDMPGAQVAVSNYKPADWPEGTSMLIRRVALDAADISTDPRARRRRTSPKDQLQLALDGQVSTVYGYSFILTDLDVSTGTKAVSVETGTGTAPRSRTVSATANTAPRCATCPPATPRSTPHGCGARY